MFWLITVWRPDDESKRVEIVVESVLGAVHSDEFFTLFDGLDIVTSDYGADHLCD